MSSPLPPSSLYFALYPEQRPGAALELPDLGLPTEPPQYVAPQLLAEPPPDLRTRLAYALANYQGHAPRPFESGGSRFLSGLLSGGARGYSAGGVLRDQRATMMREAENRRRLTEADRNYLNAKATAERQAALGDQKALAEYREGLMRGRPKSDNEEWTVVPNEPKVSAALGIPVGGKVKVGTLLQARGFLKPAASGGGAGYGTPDEQRAEASRLLDGMVAGIIAPFPESVVPLRDPTRKLINTLAVERGVDLGRLQLGWFAEKRGLSAANAPQQQRMRQAAETIPTLLPQAVALSAKLKNSPIQAVNWFGQAKAKALGEPALKALNEYKTVAKKLATEQAFLQVGGNDPPVPLIDMLYEQLDPTQAPSGLAGGFNAITTTLAAYTNSIKNVGPVTPTQPYQYPGQSNPIGGSQNYGGAYTRGAAPPTELPPGITEMVIDPRTGGLVPKVGR